MEHAGDHVPQHTDFEQAYVTLYKGDDCGLTVLRQYLEGPLGNPDVTNADGMTLLHQVTTNISNGVQFHITLFTAKN